MLIIKYKMFVQETYKHKCNTEKIFLQRTSKIGAPNCSQLTNTACLKLGLHGL